MNHLTYRYRSTKLMKTYRQLFQNYVPRNAPYFSKSGDFSISNTAAGAYLETARVFTREDILLFSKVSGDVNRVHYEAVPPFDHPIVHGILVSSLFSYLISFDGAIYLNQTLEFKAPVHVGSAVIARVEVIDSKLRSIGNIVTCRTTCRAKGSGVLAIDGKATVLLPSKGNKCN
jgi:3-hydroxybutyryl-CoA dehydratase